MNANRIRACKLVRKCIDKDICDVFLGNCNINDHTMRTTSYQSLLKIPKNQTEFTRALLNSIFSNQINVALLILVYFHFLIVLKILILLLKVIFVFRFSAIFFFFKACLYFSWRGP